MADLRKLAEAREWSSNVDEHHAQEDPDPWICDVRDGNDRLRVVLAEVDRLTLDLNTYRTFAVGIARMVASPGAEDTADELEALDLGTLEDVVRAEYGNGHAAGDRARFARCAEDLARALGLDVRRAPDWGEMVGRVRDVVRRAEMAAARWKWSGVFVLPSARGLWFTAPGAKSDTLVAVIQPRDDGMLSVKVNGQKRTAAADLPAALATIRAVLGGDVPEIPNERSES